MNAAVDKWLDDHQNELIKDLQECIKYNTLEGTPEEGKPFGPIVDACLENTLSLARRLGFKAWSLDGYCGIVEYGEGEETVGVLAHLDIVPVGDGWDFDPFAGVINDGKLYGRGTLDDKGPAIMSLYALAALKETAVALKRKIRIILGCNEETGMRCVKYYVEKEGMPTMSFSPDAGYPVTSSEKSHLNAWLSKAYDSSIKLDAGTASNICPGKAEAFVKMAKKDVEEQLAKSEIPEGITYECAEENGGTKIFVYGVQCHASNPQNGKNALQAAIYIMAQLDLPKADKEILEGLKAAFGMYYFGESLGLDKSDYSGRFTMNMGVCHWDESGLKTLVIDTRDPNSMPEEELKDAFAKAAQKAGCDLAKTSYGKGFSVPEDSELVSKLLNVFIERTGKTDAKPKRIGGGTYARCLTNAVSFGPEGYNCPSNCHVANEFITLEQLDFNSKMIADAMIALAGK